MRTGVIYKVTCITNNKFIIGSTLNFIRRKSGYMSGFKNQKWNNSYLQNCYNKYGKTSIKFEIIKDNIPELILRDVENIYIGALCSRLEDNKNGLNMQDAYGKDRLKKCYKTVFKKIEKNNYNIPKLTKYWNYMYN